MLGFPPANVNNDDDFDIPLRDGIDIARGTSGEVESGSYSIELNGTSASPSVQKLLGDYRDKGMVEEIWRHTESGFRRLIDRGT